LAGGNTAKKTEAQVRHAISVLKKAGIVDVKNVRDAKPQWVRKAGPRGGTYTLAELVDKYDDLISGKQTPIKLPESETKLLKKRGYEVTKGGKVLYPHAATETVKVTHGKPDVQHMAGISRIQLEVDYHNIPQYLKDLKKQAPKINKQLKRGAQLAFHYHGGHSMTFRTMQQLLDYLEHDGSGSLALLQHPNRLDSRTQNEMYKNLEIVQVTPAAWERSKEAARAKARAAKQEKPHRRRRKLDKLEKGSKARLDAYRRDRAREAKEYRDNMTPAQKAAYKEAAKKRAAKSRRKRK